MPLADCTLVWGVLLKGDVALMQAAAPVGKWALEQGFRAAVGLVTYSIQSAQKKDKGGKAKDNGKASKNTKGKQSR